MVDHTSSSIKGFVMFSSIHFVFNRKPRINAQIAAQQVAQQYVPPPPKKEKSATNVRTDSPNVNNNNESSNDSYDTQIHQVNNTQVNNSVIDSEPDVTSVNIVTAEKNNTNNSQNFNSSTTVSKKERLV